MVCIALLSDVPERQIGKVLWPMVLSQHLPGEVEENHADLSVGRQSNMVFPECKAAVMIMWLPTYWFGLPLGSISC
jgi:hypothetical protein